MTAMALKIKMKFIISRFTLINNCSLNKFFNAQFHRTQKHIFQKRSEILFLILIIIQFHITKAAEDLFMFFKNLTKYVMIKSYNRLTLLIFQIFQGYLMMHGGKLLKILWPHFNFLKFLLLLASKKSLEPFMYDQDFAYTINESVIQSILFFKSLWKQIKQKQLYQKFQKILKQNLECNQDLKQHANIFYQKQQKQVLKSNIQEKMTIQSLQIQQFQKNQNNKTHKQQFEVKITKIIKQISKDIRNQGEKVKWTELQFQEGMKSQLVRIVADSAFEDCQIQQTFDFLTSHSIIPLQKIMNAYEGQRLGYGKMIYILRALQIMGLIQINNSHFSAPIRTKYFEKSNFY